MNRFPSKTPNRETNGGRGKPFGQKRGSRKTPPNTQKARKEKKTQKKSSPPTKKKKKKTGPTPPPPKKPTQQTKKKTERSAGLEKKNSESGGGNRQKIGKREDGKARKGHLRTFEGAKTLEEKGRRVDQTPMKSECGISFEKTRKIASQHDRSGFQQGR